MLKYKNQLHYIIIDYDLKLLFQRFVVYIISRAVDKYWQKRLFGRNPVLLKVKFKKI